MSSLVEHAYLELASAGNDSEFNEGIIKVISAFAECGHSGGSASVAIPIINKLLNFQNLTPLTNNPNDWIHHPENIWGSPGGVWQNRRNPDALSIDGGKTYWFISEVINNSFLNQHQYTSNYQNVSYKKES